jgi:hypothetical protein
MAVQLDHTIVWCSNQSTSAKFLAEMLGRPAPTLSGHFDVAELDSGVSLDFADVEAQTKRSGCLYTQNSLTKSAPPTGESGVGVLHSGAAAISSGKFDPDRGRLVSTHAAKPKRRSRR